MDRRNLLKAAGAFSLAGIAPFSLGDQTPEVSKPTLKVQRLAWAGVKLRSGDVTILLDPWISPSSLGPAWKEPIDPITVETERRYVLITHLHNDHFDPAAVQSVAKNSGFAVVALDTKAAAVASKGFRTYPIRLYEPLTLGDFTMLAVPAVDGFNETQVSWVVICNGKRIIHCGDTLLHGGFWDLGSAYGPFDAAFLPINGARLKARQPFSDVEATMTPRHAVAAAVVMRAKLLVPIHYGFNDPESYLEHPNAVSELEETAKARQQLYRLVKPGETFEL